MTRMERHRRNYRSAVVSGLSNAKKKKGNEMNFDKRRDLIDAADCRSFWDLWNNQSSRIVYNPISVLRHVRASFY